MINQNIGGWNYERKTREKKVKTIQKVFLSQPETLASSVRRDDALSAFAFGFPPGLWCVFK
jgi:hypothetical protein